MTLNVPVQLVAMAVVPWRLVAMAVSVRRTVVRPLMAIVVAETLVMGRTNGMDRAR